ncbi:hypothetical protein PG911_08760 [Tenacibaculum ovolyticum]|uniref:hypothetical protein n=1 Tax=Tenacibaculum ovolyticum TaxID=104270 RepID=UPI0022F3FE9D|nr:hypothetical protein [Tenacibaculum ovolyticum]WBX78336.1 hypothetical protein PG911_08760 [Tenacibaculum ovolyticum]
MRKQLNKAKDKIKFLQEYMEHFGDRVRALEKKDKRKKDNQMKIMRAVITVSFVIIALASLYSIFFKQ